MIHPRIKPLGLPLEAHLDRLRGHLHTGTGLVVSAEPGAGKTTLVPLSLLQEPWLASKKILMLEPRRLAAQAAARRMADLLGEPVGQTAGYRIALDTCVSPATRIEVLTEGILTRMIQDDAELKDVGVLIFDEFHERSLHADLALALALEVRENLRPDLRLVVMSATLDLEGVSGLLGGAPSLDCQGRSFPVDVEHHPLPEKYLNPWNHGPQFSAPWTAQIIQTELKKPGGNLLVFLPGQGEINRVLSELGRPPDGTEFLPLFGTMSGKEQLRALTPPPAGIRRVVLATNLAETSLTLPGITVVIDSGLVRLNRFDPGSGMDRLVTERVSRASSLQRQGRAGRTAPGRCLKLWPAAERLQDFADPEISRSDLVPAVLEAAVWGAKKPTDLRWLSPPPAGLWNQAAELLHSLEALDDQGRVTPHGRSLASRGMHPRLGHMAEKARTLKLEPAALAIAALLGDRDILSGGADSDFRLRLEIFWNLASPRGEVNQTVLQRAREQYRRWLGKTAEPAPPAALLDKTGLLLALAFPDRVAKRQDGTIQQAQYQFANGRAGVVSGHLASEPWLVAPDLDAGAVQAKVYLAAPVSEADLRLHLSHQFHKAAAVTWTGLKPRLRSETRFGKIVLASHDQPPAAEHVADLKTAFFDRLRSEGLSLLPWTDDARQSLARLHFAAARLAKTQPGQGPWPDLSEAALLAQAETWLAPFLTPGKGDILTPDQLRDALENTLTWNQRSLVDREAPTHLTVPSGSRKKIEYPEGQSPFLAVRIQEIFGLPASPLLCGQPLVLHLLSPAQRPLQVTADLASFWQNTWPEVKKEMKGRYPRHYWPDNPLEAEPTARAKPRGT